jgi:2-hydroxychromene-2-carboxylate isomerase
VPPRFYFGAISPYSWFAAERIGELAPDAQWRPVFAGALFRSVGRTTWGLTPQRQERIADCQRRAAEHGLGPISWPQGWPGNDVLPARAMLAADRAGLLIPFAVAAMRACFREGRDITQPEELEAVAAIIGMDGPRLLEQTEEPAIKKALRAVNDEAVAAGVVGVPSVVVDGQVFWGDDRLSEASSRCRRSGRPPAREPEPLPQGFPAELAGFGEARSSAGLAPRGRVTARWHDLIG